MKSPTSPSRRLSELLSTIAALTRLHPAVQACLLHQLAPTRERGSHPPPARTAPPHGSYIKTCLGGPTPAEHEAVLAENEALKAELADARAEVAALQAKVRACTCAAAACMRTGGPMHQACMRASCVHACLIACGAALHAPCVAP